MSDCQTYDFFSFLVKDLYNGQIYFPNDEYHPKILCFTANYSSKNFVAQIYKFYFQQKPHVRLFFIFNPQFRTNYSAFGTPPQKNCATKIVCRAMNTFKKKTPITTNREF